MIVRFFTVADRAKVIRFSIKVDNLTSKFESTSSVSFETNIDDFLLITVSQYSLSHELILKTRLQRTVFDDSIEVKLLSRL